MLSLTHQHQRLGDRQISIILIFLDFTMVLEKQAPQLNKKKEKLKSDSTALTQAQRLGNNNN